MRTRWIAAAAWVVAAALFVGWGWALVAAAAAAVLVIGLGRPRLAGLVTLGIVAFIGMVIVWVVHDERPWPDAGWPSRFEWLHGLGMFAAVSLVVTMRRRERPTGPMPNMTALATEVVAQPSEGVTNGQADADRWRSWFALSTLAGSRSRRSSSRSAGQLSRDGCRCWTAATSPCAPGMCSRLTTRGSAPGRRAHSLGRRGRSATSDRCNSTCSRHSPSSIPTGGTVIGIGIVAAASVVAVWWATNRVLGPIGAGGAMLATLALEATHRYASHSSIHGSTSTC